MAKPSGLSMGTILNTTYLLSTAASFDARQPLRKHLHHVRPVGLTRVRPPAYHHTSASQSALLIGTLLQTLVDEPERHF